MGVATLPRFMKTCDRCKRKDDDLDFLGRCNDCFKIDIWRTEGPYRLNVPYFKEMGVANPADPEASTAHVRDIQDRRYDDHEKRTFYHSKELPKTYFLPKGK